MKIRNFLLCVVCFIWPAIIFIWPVVILAQSREPAVSGAFYPGNPEVLRKTVGEFLEKAQIDKTILPSGQLIGLICPHAGYPYSGPVAGYSYRLLEGLQFDTVIIIGPNHRVWGFNDVSVWNKGPFKTPLGEIPIDTELADSIINATPKKFIFHPQAHKDEHSIEVQLPFLQVVLKDFKIVPIVMGDFSGATCKELASAILKNIGNRKVLVIASTDLSHDMTYDVAVKMDKLGLDCATDIKLEELIELEASGKTQMCGFGPVLTLLYMVREMGPPGRVKGVQLKYANSGDVTGDKYGRIVGYGAVGFYSVKDGSQAEADQPLEQTSGGKEGEKMNNPYTLEEKKALLKLARDTITDYLTTGKSGEYPVFSEKFNENRGVFVTLQKHGDLRGCIGYIEPIKPLQQAVIDNAINSATQDPRFSPVTLKELGDIEIEISVLSVPEEIKGPEEFITGKHGIIIRKGFRSAVFLPQVAPEQGWTREETLAHLCLKAGLPPDEWKKPGMRFFVFTADVFSEHELHE